MDVDYGFQLETDYLDQQRWYADVYQTESSAEASPLTPPSEIMDGLFPTVPCDFTPVPGYVNPYETPVEGRSAAEEAPYKAARQAVAYGGHTDQAMSQLDTAAPYYYQTGGGPGLDAPGGKKRTTSRDSSEVQPSSQRTNAKLRTAARKPRKQSVSSASTASSSSAPARSSKHSTKTPLSPTGPPPTEEVRRARHNHNLVEKQYRNRLNGHFERLIAVLPPTTGDDDDDYDGFGDGFGGSGGAVDDPRRRLSKAEVLELARRRIKFLERQNETLRMEQERLLAKIGRR